MSVIEKTLLESLQVDPRRPAVASACPFCADGKLVFGHSVTTGNACLGHSAVPDPFDKTGRAGLAGCEVFRAIAPTNPREFVRMARTHGAHWSPLTD